MTHLSLTIRLICRVFLVVIPLLGVAIVAGIAAYWGFGYNRLWDNTLVLHELDPVPDRRIYGLFAAAVPGWLALLALWHLFNVFSQTQAGAGLALRVIHHLRAFSRYSILMALAAFVLSGVMRWAMGAFNDAPFWTHLNFSITHLIVIVGATIIHVSSHLIEQGYQFGQEVQEYV